jgi:hypothetical protein
MISVYLSVYNIFAVNKLSFVLRIDMNLFQKLAINYYPRSKIILLDSPKY